MTGMTPAVATLLASLLVLALAFAFDLYCIRDLRAAPVVLVLPRETWLYVILFLTPLGGMTYLAIGRPR
jgi:hypothetical protein